MENTKRDLSLDFTKPRLMRGGGHSAPSLVTPILNLSTPEINKMITGEELAILTPNGISSILPQSGILQSPLIPTTVNSNIMLSPAANKNLMHIGNNGSNSDHSSCNQKITDDNGDVKPKDMDFDKIEKKRERNRLAAKKCRQRKLETIDELRKANGEWEQRYDILKKEHEKFKLVKSKEIDHLHHQISELKSMLGQ